MSDVIESTAIAVSEPHVPAKLFSGRSGAEIITDASEKATALADVIESRKLFSVINGRKHVRVEGWTLLGSLVGVFPVCVWTRETEHGWEARVEARTLDGAVVGAAEAECLKTERTWATRDSYALRSMAQTRATSKALRQPLGFIMVLGGYEATPQEEIPDEEDGYGRGKVSKEAVSNAQRAYAENRSQRPQDAAPAPKENGAAPKSGWQQFLDALVKEGFSDTDVANFIGSEGCTKEEVGAYIGERNMTLVGLLSAMQVDRVRQTNDVP